MSGRTVNERIAARRAEVRSARRRARLRRTVVVVVLVGLVLGGLALERSSLVALASVRVTGLERLAEQDVVAAADVPLGTSVLRIRRSAVAERVAALPLVESAEVERDGALGLVVRVEEVSPAVTAVYRGGPLLVSADGLVLGEGSADGTPRVEVAGPAPEPGATLAELPTLATAHEVVLALSGPLAALVDHARAVAPDSVELELDSGVVVRWGDATRHDEKERALGAVLEDLDGREVTAIDVRAPGAPTVTP